MLKVKLTENFGGFEISGDWDELNFLYDSISYLLREENAEESMGEYIMKNHLYAFLYEVRHAYQGSREYELIENGLTEEDRKYLKIRKKDATNNNFYFKFNYIVPDLIQDMILIKYFTDKVPKKENDIYNLYINNVNLFYSNVLSALKSMVTDIQFSKIKKGLLNAYFIDTSYIPQWFEIISIDYANMSRDKRAKGIMHTLDAVYNCFDYEDYYNMKIKLGKQCKEENCTLDDIYYDGYPEDIEW